MQVINISGGAKVRLIQEYAGYKNELTTQHQPGPKHGFKVYSLKEQWNRENLKPFSLVNGQFFNPTFARRLNYTILSYPIRMDHQYAQGYETQDLSQKDRQLEINSYAADVLPYNPSRSKHGPNPIVLTGFHPDSNIPRADAFIWRTALCSRYVNGSWLLYIATLNGKNRAGLKSSMSSWGCDIQNKTLVLDGGGSTGLIYTNHYGSMHFTGSPGNRKIPQMIAVYNK